MPPSNYLSDGTSTELERVALDRYRRLVGILPPNCYVYREPWGCSTVLCLDFADCPFWLPTMQHSADILLQGSESIGLAQALVFRQGRKFIGLKTRSPIR
ncbi:MAG: hypothetical protein ACRC6M_11615 [Microcystaceae cyanobacterium]